MEGLSEDYHLRKHFLKSNEVPSQSLIKKKMSPALAAVYFNSMSPKLKVLAGLEPPMKGGGGDWYVPPKDILKGRTVLKPIGKKVLSQLNYLGIDKIGMKLQELRIKKLKHDGEVMTQKSDLDWKTIIEDECKQHFLQVSQESAKKNTERIQNAFHEFTTLYSSSLTKLENILLESARGEVDKFQHEAEERMQNKYKTMLKQQATSLYDKYREQLDKEKEALKSEFIKKLEKERTETTQIVHDIQLEKRTVVEKMRQFLHCQMLACQIYVALKEKEECGREIKISQEEHKKKAKQLKDEILSKSYEISLQIEKEKKRAEFEESWDEKISRTVKKFHQFVTYCLELLPQHAEFFINTEKLFLMQINEAMKVPSAESIFEVEEVEYMGPKPIPRAFYLFCDIGEKFKVDPELCPRLRGTGSSAQLPVIVVNKRCLYAACDNFEQFTNKIKMYFYGERGDDADIVDDNTYENYVPIKYTNSQELAELKLEGSLLQILQEERPNVQGLNYYAECGMPHCFCGSADSFGSFAKGKAPEPPPEAPVKGKVLTKKDEMKHLREPKVQSYAEYIKPRRCTCAKMAKKHLMKHLPPYMRMESKFASAEIPNYEPCTLEELKRIVEGARRKDKPSTPAPAPSRVSSSTAAPKVTRDIGTQYSVPDLQFEYLCNCFSDEDLHQAYSLLKDNIIGDKLYDPAETCKQFRIVDENLLIKSRRSSALPQEKTQSLKTLLENAPAFDELFKFGGRTYE